MMERVPPLAGQAQSAPDGAAPGRDRFLFEATPVPLWLLDLETLRFLDVNEAACRKYGYGRDEFLSMTLRDLHPSADVGALDPSAMSAASGAPMAGVWRHRLKDGALIHVEIASQAKTFRRRPALFACPIDVTQRVRTEDALRERESALRRAQGLARLAHAVTGADGEFLSWSESLPDLIGAPSSRMPTSTREWLALIHADDRAMFRERSIEAAIARLRVDVDYRLRKPDGGLVHLRQAIEPILDAGGAFGGRWFNTLQDVTEQKTAESLVADAKDELERRVRERTLQLEVSNCELAFATAAAERANRAKGEFFSSMSHELRTPLNAILGFGELLAMPEAVSRGDAQRAAFAGHIVEAGRHLLALINRMLDPAQIGAGEAEPRIRPVALDGLLAECGAIAVPLAAGRGIEVRFPARCGATPLADRTRLKQALLNLLSDAIGRARARGGVDVDVETARDRVRINVRETGAGMTQAQAASLLQARGRLGRDDGVERGDAGLAATKRLVELMGGTLGVDSAPGAGSVLHIELPQAPAGPPGAEAG